MLALPPPGRSGGGSASIEVTDPGAGIRRSTSPPSAFSGKQACQRHDNMFTSVCYSAMLTAQLACYVSSTFCNCDLIHSENARTTGWSTFACSCTRK